MKYSIWTTCDSCDEIVLVKVEDLSKSYLVHCPKCEVTSKQKLRLEGSR